MDNKVIAVIGAGGKTSVIEHIALENSHKKLLITTTTHIYPVLSPVSRRTLIDPEKEELFSALKEGGVVCAGKSGKEGKITSLDKDVLNETINQVDLALIEADGSRRLPLKLHNEYEPVMPEKYDLCIVVAGLGALGKEVCEAIHRYELNSEWKKNPSLKVGKDEIIYCIEDAVSCAEVDESKVLVILNQADTPEIRKVGEEICSSLRYKSVTVSLKNGDKLPL